MPSFVVLSDWFDFCAHCHTFPPPLSLSPVVSSFISQLLLSTFFSFFLSLFPLADRDRHHYRRSNDLSPPFAGKAPRNVTGPVLHLKEEKGESRRKGCTPPPHTRAHHEIFVTTRDGTLLSPRHSVSGQRLSLFRLSSPSLSFFLSQSSFLDFL